jgi:hypothetical protein
VTWEFIAAAKRLVAGDWVLPSAEIPVGPGDSTVRLLSLSGSSLYDPDVENPEEPPVDLRIPAGWVVLQDENFNSSAWTTATGAHPSSALWNQRMGLGTGVAGGSTTNLNDTYLFDKGNGDRCLRFRMPAGYNDKGTTMWANLPSTVNGHPIDEAIFEYSIKFVGNWDPWGWGGKLPGLGGVRPGASVSAPSGGNGGTDGWSGRLMWIGRDAGGGGPYSGSRGSRKNIGLYYNYGFDQVEKDPPTAYGDNGWFNTPASQDTFKSDVWHKVRIHYRLNTVGQANGFVQVKLDSQVVYEKRTWRPRNRTDIHIGQVWWHFFRGGNDADWSVATEEDILIDNVLLVTPA